MSQNRHLQSQYGGKNTSEELWWLPWKYMGYIFNMFSTPAQPLCSNCSSSPTPNSPTQILPRPAGIWLHWWNDSMLTELHHGRTWHHIRIIERLSESEHRCSRSNEAECLHESYRCFYFLKKQIFVQNPHSHHTCVWIAWNLGMFWGRSKHQICGLL